MAELVSPGVSVSIIDESFYAPAGTGTVPLIVVATRQDKTTPDGISVAENTTAATAGEVQLVTSQRDLLYRYGSPVFATNTNGASLVSELNEYGLFAAYSFLGVANRAYILRADVDLGDLDPSPSAPTVGPVAGSYWLDTTDMVWGLKKWNGTTYVRQSVMVVPDSQVTSSNFIDNSFGNEGEFAVKYQDYNGGSYTTADTVTIWQKLSTDGGTEWFLVGSSGWDTNSGGKDFQIVNHTNLPPAINGRANGQNLEVDDLILQMNAANNGTVSGLKAYSGGQWTLQSIYGSDLSNSAHANYVTGGGLSEGDLWFDYSSETATIEIKRWNGSNQTVAQSGTLTDTSINVTSHAPSVTVSVSSTGGADAILSAELGGVGVNTYIDAIAITDGGTGYGVGNVVTVADSNNNGSGFTATVTQVGVTGNIEAVTITNSGSGYFKTSFVITVNDNDDAIPVALYGYDDGVAGNISVSAIVHAIQDSISETDNALTDWKDLSVSNENNKITITSTSGYEIAFSDGQVTGFSYTDLLLDAVYSNWVTLSYEASDQELEGTLPNGTLWYDNLISNNHIDILYNNLGTWTSYSAAGFDVNVSGSEPTKPSTGTGSLQTGDLWIDSSDTENYPMIYKYSEISGSWTLIDNTDQVTDNGIVFGDFRSSFGQPGMDDDLVTNGLQATLYPYGILAWNKRLSGGNVKEWDNVNERWNDRSGNKIDGSPYMLRKAQRQVVIAGMQAALNENTNIRNENNRFNLIASPGYTECLDEMLTLSQDRKYTAFVIADTPFRLESDAQSILRWATNDSGLGNNDDAGLVTASEYAAVYYPHGLTSNLEGIDVVVPASHMVLRTYAYNDQVAYPWFAPAGFQRGTVTNASSVGYVDPDTNDFVQVSLNEGQRDTMYTNKLNPIAQFPGRGISVFGQKTLYAESSALDRVNVARLVVYLRERLDDIVKPFLFEPNDEITRQNAKVIVDRFLGNLVSQRGLYDFVTVCDTTNNTPARIDRNELWIDIAVQPVKAVEFIYIPVRIQNTLGG